MRGGSALAESERWAWNGSEYVMLSFVLAGIAHIALVGAPFPWIVWDTRSSRLRFAIALLLRRFPWLGYATLGVMSIDLFDFAAVFARDHRSLRVVDAGIDLRP